MEIDGGLFQIAMAQQDLDGPQIRSVFQQVSGEAVTQGVRMDLLPNSRLLPERLHRPAQYAQQFIHASVS